MKKNSADNYESINVLLSKKKTPIAFGKKVSELVESGLSEKEAEVYVSQTEIEMEFYYSDGLGLFMVESEAVECCTIVNPYTGEKLEDNDDYGDFMCNNCGGGFTRDEIVTDDDGDDYCKSCK